MRMAGYPTPVTEAAGTDPVFVGRIRNDISHPKGLNLWVVADNVRKGRCAEQCADCGVTASVRVPAGLKMGPAHQ